VNTVENRALPSDEQFRKQCSEAGVRPDRPLFGLLIEMRDIVEIASDAVRGGARGLTPDGEAELIKCINATVQASSERHRLRLERRASWIAGGVVVTSLLLGSLGGYWWGWISGRQSVQVLQEEVAAAFQNSSPEAASTWLRLMRHNDPRQALKRCTGNAVSAGGRACLVPLWIDGPSTPEISKK
jgi:hypothetical protein